MQIFNVSFVFQAFATKQNFWAMQLALLRQSLNYSFSYIEILIYYLLYYSLLSHAFLNICFQYPDNWISQFLSDWCTYALRFLIPDLLPYLQSKSIDRQLPPINLYWCNFFSWWGSMWQRMNCEVIKLNLLFILVLF